MIRQNEEDNGEDTLKRDELCTNPHNEYSKTYGKKNIIFNTKDIINEEYIDENEKILEILKDYKLEWKDIHQYTQKYKIKKEIDIPWQIPMELSVLGFPISVQKMILCSLVIPNQHILCNLSNVTIPQDKVIIYPYPLDNTIQKEYQGRITTIYQYINEYKQDITLNTENLEYIQLQYMNIQYSSYQVRYQNLLTEGTNDSDVNIDTKDIDTDKNIENKDVSTDKNIENKDTYTDENINIDDKLNNLHQYILQFAKSQNLIFGYSVSVQFCSPETSIDTQIYGDDTNTYSFSPLPEYVSSSYFSAYCKFNTKYDDTLLIYYNNYPPQLHDICFLVHIDTTSKDVLNKLDSILCTKEIILNTIKRRLPKNQLCLLFRDNPQYNEPDTTEIQNLPQTLCDKCLLEIDIPSNFFIDIQKYLYTIQSMMKRYIYTLDISSILKPFYPTHSLALTELFLPIVDTITQEKNLLLSSTNIPILNPIDHILYNKDINMPERALLPPFLPNIYNVIKDTIKIIQISPITKIYIYDIFSILSVSTKFLIPPTGIAFQSFQKFLYIYSMLQGRAYIIPRFIPPLCPTIFSHRTIIYNNNITSKKVLSTTLYSYTIPNISDTAHYLKKIYEYNIQNLCKRFYNIISIDCEDDSKYNDKCEYNDEDTFENGNELNYDILETITVSNLRSNIQLNRQIIYYICNTIVQAPK